MECIGVFDNKEKKLVFWDSFDSPEKADAAEIMLLSKYDEPNEDALFEDYEYYNDFLSDAVWAEEGRYTQVRMSVPANQTVEQLKQEFISENS